MKARKHSMRVAGIALCAGLAASTIAAGGASVRAGIAPSQEATIQLLLDRWQPVSSDLRVDAKIWREQFAALLRAASTETLQSLAQTPAEASAEASRVDAYSKVLGAASRSAAESFKKKTFGAKLGSTTSDQVFVPITPCRIVDTRIAGGQLVAGIARNYFFWTANPAASWSEQGGADGAADTACPGTVNPGGGSPAAAIATITVVSPTQAGNFVAWGGANPVPVTSVLNWRNPDDIAANTTVIPAGGRSGTGPGGAIGDFAIYYNGPSGAAHVVIDVVGYFTENAATALDCYLTTPATQSLTPSAQQYDVFSPACVAGYTAVSAKCSGTGDFYNLRQSGGGVDDTGTASFCFGTYIGSTTVSVEVSARCCRLPGK